MNTVYTQDQIALQQHIEAENAKWVAQLVENGSTTFYTTTVTDPAHWATYGITTIAQYERHCLVSSIWDAYKEAHGIRPRWVDFDSLSMEELQKMESQVFADLQQEIEDEKREEEEAIQRMLDAGAADRETAVRWLLEAEEAA
jgi:hypothetical protein